MNSLKLISPTLSLEKEYNEMMAEWNASKEEYIPWTLGLYKKSFKEYVEKLEEHSKGINLPEKLIPHSSFWLVNENGKVLGTSNLRHRLTEQLLIKGGHIGYGIRPSERRKGNATKILELTLLEAKKLGIEKALITCNKSNIGSAKTIVKNGGIFWKEASFPKRITQYYWVEI